jgi:hypothetical protein
MRLLKLTLYEEFSPPLLLSINITPKWKLGIIKSKEAITLVYYFCGIGK